MVRKLLKSIRFNMLPYHMRCAEKHCCLHEFHYQYFVAFEYRLAVIGKLGFKANSF